MKKLNLLDQSTSFKVNDTGTIIPFNAYEDKEPFGVTENETSVFRIKNEMGFLKAVNATNAAGGYIFQLNTKDLVGLVPGTYEIELVVTDGKTNAELIFPDTGFCSFNITNSALTVTGTQIPTMSLDSFKQQLEQYVQLQTNGKLDSIKSDFETYVNSVKQGPAGPQGEPGADGKPASIVVGSTTTADVGASADVTNTGTSINAILNFKIPRGPQGPKGDRGPAGGASSIKVGSTTTVDAGEKATVTNSGNDVDAVLDFSIPKGEKGDPGSSGADGKDASVAVGSVNNYNPWLAYSSIGKEYNKGYILPAGEFSDASDIYTDYFYVIGGNSCSVSFPANLNSLSGDEALRIVWYDNSKNALSCDEQKNVSFPYVFTKTAPLGAVYARVCCYVGNNWNVDGTNTPIYVSDNGSMNISNSGDSNNATFDFNLASGPMGMQGPQGIKGDKGDDGSKGDIGPQGPQGNIGDYVTGTGWLDLTPCMDTSNVYVSGNIYVARYAIETINNLTRFKWWIHAKIQDSSKLGSWGALRLFDASQIVSNYGGWDEGQYVLSNADLSHGGVFAVNTKKNNGSYWVENRGNIITPSSQTGQASIYSIGEVYLG